MQTPPHEYRPPTLPTYAERKREKERLLAVAAGRDIGAVDGLTAATDPSSNLQQHPSSSSFPHQSATSLDNVPPTRHQPSYALQVDSPSSSNSNRRPLPQPANAPPAHRTTTPFNNSSIPQTSSAPRSLHHFASHMHLGSPSRDRQRSLPQPTVGSLRTMPSLPHIQQQPVIPDARPLPQVNPSLPPLTGETTLSRQLATPVLNSRTGRPLPTPLGHPPNLQPVPEPYTSPIVPSSSPAAQLPSLVNADYGVRWSSAPVIDRSDTISSIKSLDRYILSHPSPQHQHPPRLTSTTSGNVRGRPLPPPPATVKTMNERGGAGSIPSLLDRGALGTTLDMSAETGNIGKRDVGEIGGDGERRDDERKRGDGRKRGGDERSRGDERRINGEGQDGVKERSTTPMTSKDSEALPVLDISASSPHGMSRAPPQMEDPRPVHQTSTPTTSHTTPQISVSIAQPVNDSEVPVMPTIAFPDSTDPCDKIIVVPRSRSPLPVPPTCQSPAVPLIAIAVSGINNEIQSSVPKISVSPNGGPSPTISVPVISFPDDADATPQPVPTPPSPPKQPTGPGIHCSGCRLPILGSVIKAAGSRWHPDCLRCTTCQVGLEHVSRYEHEGRPYCHMDYFEQFGRRCHHCSTPIIEQRYITIDDPALGQRYYHELHFFCGECGTPFLDPSRSSSAGTETRAKSSDAGEDDQTAAYVIHGRHAFCPECDIKLHRTKCKGCKLPIRDEEGALEALKGKWHQKCFKCASCLQPIPSEYFVPINRNPYCQDCYERT